MKKCPYCAEHIEEDAIKCRYCGEWLKRFKKNPIKLWLKNSPRTINLISWFSLYSLGCIIFIVILLLGLAFGLSERALGPISMGLALGVAVLINRSDLQPKLADFITKLLSS